MEPIYDRSGRVVGWLGGNDVYHLNGSHAAVVIGPNVYGHRGQQLGVFGGGFFRDHDGAVVAFIRGASGGPVLPAQSLHPAPPIPSVPPVPAVPAVPRVPAAPSSSWGSDWRSFINA